MTQSCVKTRTVRSEQIRSPTRETFAIFLRIIWRREIATPPRAQKPAPWLVRLIWTLVILLVLIGVAAATRRAVALTSPGASGAGKNPAAALDANFVPHRTITFIHIVPGALFMILGPLQFVVRLRNRWPRFHRWSGRLFMVLSLIVGLSALAMSFTTSIGGANETAATTMFALIFLFDLTKGYTKILGRRFLEHREWMIRTFSIGLAVATIRPIVGIFFATRRLSPHEFFGIAFWIGFTLHLILAEVWISYTRGIRQVLPTSVAKLEPAISSHLP